MNTYILWNKAATKYTQFFETSPSLQFAYKTQNKSEKLVNCLLWDATPCNLLSCGIPQMCIDLLSDLSNLGTRYPLPKSQISLRKTITLGGKLGGFMEVSWRIPTMQYPCVCRTENVDFLPHAPTNESQFKSYQWYKTFQRSPGSVMWIPVQI